MTYGTSVLAAALSLFAASTAYAHIEIDDPGTAGDTQVVTFSVEHGCQGFDTYSIEIQIPPGIASVRPLFGGAFGAPTVKKDATGAVTSVLWTKSDVAATDTNYYELSIRMGLPNAPFTTLYMTTTQLCRDPATNMQYETDWVATTPSTSDDGPEPAPALFLLPAHNPGWNQFTVPVALTDLSVFDDAQIVWAGNAAYSSNAATVDLIKKEPDTTVLTTIAAGTAIWVKY